MSSSYTQYSEESLFAAIAQDDTEAFTELFKRYSRRIQSLAYKLIKSKEAAEDITQEVFIWIWNHRKSIADVGVVQSYLFKMAANRTNNFLRSMLNDERKFHQLAEIMRDRMAEGADQKALLHNGEQLLSEAIGQLPLQQQKVYKLHFFEEMDYEQIAKQLEISPNTVRNHLVAANRSVRGYLIRQNGILPALLCSIFLIK